jgi:uncharacterized protein
MIVGMARAELELPAGGTLKDKRRVVKSLVTRVRQRFAVACAEVDRLDDHHRSTLGIAVVSNDRTHAAQVLVSVESFLATAQEALLLEFDREMASLPGSP